MPEGVALARIKAGDDGHPPHVELCEFFPLESAAGQQELLAELVDGYGLARSHCLSVMPGNFSLLLVEAPQVDAAELKAAVRWQIKDLIDFHIDDAVIDVFDIPGQEARGRQKMMYVVAARVSTVQEHIDLLEGAGAALSVIDIPELALRNIAALLPEGPGGVALLHFTRHGGLLTLSRDGELYLSRNLEMGCEALHSQLQADAGVELGGMSLESQENEGGFSPGMTRLLDSIVLEVQRSLDYYESHFSLPPVGGLVLAPTEEPIPGMLSYIASNLSVPVRTLDLNAVLDSETTLSDALQSRALLAIGAALRREEKVL